MPQVRATLPERYAIALVLGILGAAALFIVSTFLLIGIAQGSAPLWAWAGILAAEGVALIVGFFLVMLWHHDRALMRDPQAYRGELA
jgi:hypothetical protein